jgi:hypothetical protein
MKAIFSPAPPFFSGSKLPLFCKGSPHWRKEGNRKVTPKLPAVEQSLRERL